MFYARINKIKVFDNREGFFGLFNRAELRIYSLVTGRSSFTPPLWGGAGGEVTIADLIDLTDEQRKEKLLEVVLSGVERFSESHSLEINGVKDNQSLVFGDAGLVIYQSDVIPAELNLQLWVIESDSDVRRWAVEAGTVLDSDAFKGLLTAVGAALTVAKPVLSGVIAVGGVVTNLLRQKLKANRDDLVGYWQATLSREEHYPYGARDKQDSPDTTGNILVDYMLFGFENSLAPDLSPGPSPQERGGASDKIPEINLPASEEVEIKETVPQLSAPLSPSPSPQERASDKIPEINLPASEEAEIKETVPPLSAPLSPSPSPQERGGASDKIPEINLPAREEAEIKEIVPPLSAPLSLWRGAGGEVEFVRQVYPAAQRLYESGDGLHPLFVTAQAALETGWKIKATGNNIFGITKGASWTGATNLLPTTEIFGTPDKQFTPPEKVVSVEQIAPDKYRYRVYRLFRAYDSPEDSLSDHLALLKGSLYRNAWPYRHDSREYARQIAPVYATSPDYANTLVAVIDTVEKYLNLDLLD
jgi:flagellar protein FlgJ